MISFLKPLGIRKALIAAFALIICAILALIPFLCSRIDRPASLKIVNISAYDTFGFPTILDVKVINKGERIAFIKKAKFLVSKIWCLKQDVHYRVVPISGTYNVELPYEKTPYDTSIDLSQAVGGDNEDQFQFLLNCDYLSLKNITFKEFFDSSVTSSFNKVDFELKKTQEMLVFEVSVKLIYNESDKIAEYKPIIFQMQPKWTAMGYYYPSDESTIKQMKYCIDLLEEIDRRKAYKSEGVIVLTNEDLPKMKNWLKYLKMKYGIGLHSTN